MKLSLVPSGRRKTPPFSLREDEFVRRLRADGTSAIRIAAAIEREFGVRRQPEAVNQRIKALSRTAL